MGDSPIRHGHTPPPATIHSGIVKSALPFFGIRCVGAALLLVFVFVLASGAIAYQPQSIEDCLKLEAAFSNGDKVAANIAGEDVPILQGKCVEVESETFLRILEALPRTHVPSS